MSRSSRPGQSKNMVISHRGISDPDKPALEDLRRLIDETPGTEMLVDSGGLMLVAVDPAFEARLRSSLASRPAWSIFEDGEARFPESEQPIVTTGPRSPPDESETTMPRINRRLRFSIEPGAALAGYTTVLEDPALYDDRTGYEDDFLGESVPLPRLPRRLMTDAVPLKDGSGVELKYWNFSVIQSKSRKLPFFSACNIDGAQYQRSERSNNWRYDPRIDTSYQLINECYGSDQEGFFSRGHMTRREDPVWGPNAGAAERDTFLVTNAVPQMQKHNGGLWLSLENYVLRNASKDRQRACVFTGPVLASSDPIIYGVKIPVQLWKIVAFIHDETEALSAVAYLSTQAQYLPDGGNVSFVWGQFKGLQVTVSKIAAETGLDFGALVDADVLAEADMSFAMGITKEEDLILM